MVNYFDVDARKGAGRSESMSEQGRLTLSLERELAMTNSPDTAPFTWGVSPKLLSPVGKDSWYRTKLIILQEFNFNRDRHHNVMS